MDHDASHGFGGLAPGVGDDERPSLLEQATSMVRDQATNSVAGAAVVTEREKAAQIGVKAGGSNWSLGAWFRWAKNRMTGRSDKSAGVGGEVRW